MTITLTVEELKAHQAKLDEWMIRRVKFVARQLVERSIDPFTVGGSFAERLHVQLDATCEKWDKENPMPRILPLL